MNKYSEHLHRKQVEKEILESSIKESSRCVEELDAMICLHEQARDVLNASMILTQDKVKSFVEQIVSLSLSMVYGPDYSFEMETKISRNQAEICPWILKNGVRVSPRGEVGGGVNDIAAFALRLVIYSLLRTSRTLTNTLILDEPAKFLSRDKQLLFGQMLKKISEMLDVQIIIVSHSNGIIECADKAFVVKQDHSVSTVSVVEQGAS